jgi:hypothetical protein
MVKDAPRQAGSDLFEQPEGFHPAALAGLAVSDMELRGDGRLGRWLG